MGLNLSIDLKIAPCSHEAAKYAVEHWHYSGCLPVVKLIKFGVWENNKFIGVVIFSRGANPNIGKSYNLDQTEICELTRVALNNHKNPATKIISICLKQLRKANTGLKMVVSYSDMNQNHYGIIYQAGNWVYTGAKNEKYLKINSKIMHPRSVGAKYGTRHLEWIKKNIDPDASKVNSMDKYKYLYPLTKEMKKQIEPLKKPYPKKENNASVV